jgi:hypothetical protein
VSLFACLLVDVSFFFSLWICWDIVFGNCVLGFENFGDLGFCGIIRVFRGAVSRWIW